MEKEKTIIGERVIHMKSIGSTNTELLEHAAKYTDGDVMIAEIQTAGRGRYGRNWDSVRGGLYMSILLKNIVEAQQPLKLSLLSALAVQRTLSGMAKAKFFIKWPNDVYAGNSKICGILPETRVQGTTINAVIGIGINVNNDPPAASELRTPAASLRELCGHNCDKDQVANDILQLINTFYGDIKAGRFAEYLAELDTCLYGRGKASVLKTYDGREEHIIPLGFTEDATLRCIRNGKEISLYIGEL